MIELIQGKYETAKAHYVQTHGDDCFEFQLAYVPSEENFRELDRFLWESRHERTRFRNRYEGPVLVNLTSWNAKEPNDYFDAFMYFLKDSSFLECSFMVEGTCSPKLAKSLSRFFEITEIFTEPRKTSAPKPAIGFDTAGKESDYVRI